MTREEILTMPAGRELDALVAEKIMGWRKVMHPKWGEAGWFAAGNDWLDSMIFESSWSGPPWPAYSMNIAAAWEVVEHLIHDVDADQDGYFRLDNGTMTGHPWHARFEIDGSPDDIATAETPALAICRASLLVTLPEPLRRED